MNIHIVRKYWQDSNEFLYKYSPSHIDKTKVDQATFTFLTTCGLPGDAAPFLSFSQIKEDILWTPNQIYKINLAELENYLMFGSNGSGDPICIDTTQNNEIVYLNHDNYFDRVFINSTIAQFSLCLAKYRDFIASTIDTATDDYSNRNFDEPEFELLKNDFLKIDKRCLGETTFWKIEFDHLLWERNNE